MNGYERIMETLDILVICKIVSNLSSHDTMNFVTTCSYLWNRYKKYKDEIWKIKLGKDFSGYGFVNDLKTHYCKLEKNIGIVYNWNYIGKLKNCQYFKGFKVITYDQGMFLWKYKYGNILIPGNYNKKHETEDFFIVNINYLKSDEYDDDEDIYHFFPTKKLAYSFIDDKIREFLLIYDKYFDELDKEYYQNLSVDKIPVNSVSTCHKSLIKIELWAGVINDEM